jgi:hypothetical protein
VDAKQLRLRDTPNERHPHTDGPGVGQRGPTTRECANHILVAPDVAICLFMEVDQHQC